MTEQNNAFGVELKRLRKNRKLTVRKLAELSGTSHSYLSQLENGRVNPPKPEMIKKIAKGLSLTSKDRLAVLDFFDVLMRKAGYSFEEQKYDELFDEVTDYEKYPLRGLKVIEGGRTTDGRLSIPLEEYILNQNIEITVNEKPLTQEEKIKLLEIANTIFD